MTNRDRPGGVALPAVDRWGSEDVPSLVAWLGEAQSPDLLRVRRRPLHALSDWTFDPATGNLRHRTGRFFTIEGLRVRHISGPGMPWMQPIINQSDVGILGLLVADEGGCRKALVQRKVEPGNVNVAQISPTLQATRSNYTRVHGGAVPPYLEYFLDPSAGTVVVDQLQMEQGARYCGKRNRNMIVQVRAGDVPIGPDYRWVSMDDLVSLAGCPNALNLDTRSVLSCLPGGGASAAPWVAGDAPAHIAAWLARMREGCALDVEAVPLRDVAGWGYDGESLTHESGRFFEVIGVSVEAPTREVPAWDQPLVRSCGRGVIGFLCQRQRGTLRFLARGVIEPGDPCVRIGPTVQCMSNGHRPPPLFFDEIVHAAKDQTRLRTIQSEEGGRFYHDERLLAVVEVPPDTRVDHPPEFLWMTLDEIKAMIGCGQVNIEARSLIACLPISA